MCNNAQDAQLLPILQATRYSILSFSSKNHLRVTINNNEIMDRPYHSISEIYMQPIGAIMH